MEQQRRILNQASRIDRMTRSKCKALKAASREVGANRMHRFVGLELERSVMLRNTERATQRIRTEAFAKLTLIRERRRAAFRCPTNRSLVPKKKWQGDNWQASSSAPAEKSKLHGCYI
ncbi:hypothetical protein G6F43_004547 [Rhizopus delemar]|nr:hypothetical protein G6F43_004547 [Rhizopus delemar]